MATDFLPPPPSQHHPMFAGWNWRKRSFAIVAVLMLLTPVIYVLSFAPMVRCNPGKIQVADDIFMRRSEVHHWRFYEPVNWLIDRTYLRQPLLTWAGLWGVYDEFFIQEVRREAIRDSQINLIAPRDTR